MSFNEYQYKFSFVVPIYNEAEHLGEMIKSVVGQTVGFKKNIQMILVDDGSTDNSPEIAKSYATKYPRNIKYIRQKNAGVSVARNRGIKEIKGELVVFIDADDKISKNACEEVRKYFQITPKDVNVVAMRVLNFFEDGHTTEHVLNKRLGGSKKWVTLGLDSINAITYAQSRVAGTMIKAEALKDVKFDTKLSHGEDGKFINTIICKTFRMGIVFNSIYYYRRHNFGLSAGNHRSDDYLFDMPRHYLLEFVKKYKSSDNNIPSYIQSMILYDFQYRIMANVDYVERAGRLSEYRELLCKIIKFVDDRNIVSFNGDIRFMLACFSLKYGVNAFAETKIEDGEIFWNKCRIGSIYSIPISLRRISIENNKLRLYVSYNPYVSGIKVFVKDNRGKVYMPSKEKVNLGLLKVVGEVMCQAEFMEFSIPISDKNLEVGFFVETSNKKYEIKRLYDAGSSPFIASLDASAIHRDDHILRRWIGGRINIITYPTFRQKISPELNFWQFAWQRKTLGKIWKHRVLFWLIRFWQKLLRKKKQIWIISDRPDSGGDNGWYLFKYLVENPQKNIKPYFAIDKNSPSYRRDGFLQKHPRNVLYFGEFRHQILYLLADKVISSHFGPQTCNPFEEYFYYLLRDLPQFKKVYLEHGVLASNLSALLNYPSCLIDLITLASKDEEKEIMFNHGYGYKKSQLAVTGHPRMDALLGNSSPEREKLVIISPSWRLGLNGKVKKTDEGINVREYNPDLINSGYFKFYKTLLCSKRLNRILKENDYKVEFYIHPLLAENWQDFLQFENENIIIKQPPHNYEDALLRGAIMITDYSGVAFDMAYQNKPVIYAQFDAENFYKTHTYQKGKFSFEGDGFGQVVDNIKDLIIELEKCILRNCEMEDEYKKRVDRFFTKRDGKSCERITDAILRL